MREEKRREEKRREEKRKVSYFQPHMIDPSVREGSGRASSMFLTDRVWHGGGGERVGSSAGRREGERKKGRKEDGKRRAFEQIRFVSFRFVSYPSFSFLWELKKLRSQDLGCRLSNNMHTALPSTSTPAPPKARKSTHPPSSHLSMIGACVSVFLWGLSIATACVSLLTTRVPEPA